VPLLWPVGRRWHIIPVVGSTVHIIRVGISGMVGNGQIFLSEQAHLLASNLFCGVQVKAGHTKSSAAAPENCGRNAEEESKELAL